MFSLHVLLLITKSQILELEWIEIQERQWSFVIMTVQPTLFLKMTLQENSYLLLRRYLRIFLKDNNRFLDKLFYLFNRVFNSVFHLCNLDLHFIPFYTAITLKK